MGNYNDVLLEQLAQHGNGRYAYINDRREAYREMVTNFLGNVEVLARDVKIQVEFDPRTVRAYRLIGYENRDVEDYRFRDNTRDGGEVGPGHNVTAVYELVLARKARRLGDIGTVTVRWKDDSGAEVTEMSQPVRSTKRSKHWDYPVQLRLAFTAACFAEKLKGTVFTADVNWAELRQFAAPLIEEMPTEQVTELFSMMETAERLSSYHTRRW
jgi:Ca-activated chloride channel family protein